MQLMSTRTSVAPKRTSFWQPSPASQAEVSKVVSAIRESNVSRLRALLQRGFDVTETIDSDKSTILHLAVSCSDGRVDIVAMLVEEFFVNIAAADMWGSTALDEARFSGFKKVADYLSKIAADRRQASKGWSEVLSRLRPSKVSNDEETDKPAAGAVSKGVSPDRKTISRRVSVDVIDFAGFSTFARQMSASSSNTLDVTTAHHAATRQSFAYAKRKSVSMNRQTSNMSAASIGSNGSKQSGIEQETEAEHLINLALPESPSVYLIRANAVQHLSAPWPRCQEFHASMNSCETPTISDLVIAVSHMWYFQAHPDPLGEKSSVMAKLIQNARDVCKPQGQTFAFLDFLSICQRPFRLGQADRSPQEMKNFESALRAMPLLFFYADTIVLLDTQCKSDVPHEGRVVTVTGAEMSRVCLSQMGGSVQVTTVQRSTSLKASPRAGNTLTVGPFDTVLSGNGKKMYSIESVRKLCKNEASGTSSSFQVQKAPFGKKSLTSPSERGWIYLERFIAMVKVAMAGKSERHKVVFSDSPALLKEIIEGGEALRNAAEGGSDSLRAALDQHFEELNRKVFAAISTDKAKGTGNGSKTSTSDRDAVAGIMRAMVNHLAKRWDFKRRQMVRVRFSKAVKRVVNMMNENRLPEVLSPWDCVGSPNKVDECEQLDNEGSRLSQMTVNSARMSTISEGDAQLSPRSPSSVTKDNSLVLDADQTETRNLPDNEDGELSGRDMCGKASGCPRQHNLDVICRAGHCTLC